MSPGPGHRIGAYEIVGPLGSGGMGTVYRARDTRLGRLVAVKFVSDDLAHDPTSAARLAREAALTSSLNHPNIVTVHDVGEVDGRPFIVMELVPGQSLYEAMDSGRMKPARVVDIACQIADGLAAAHGAGVVHRDLKPRNVMIAEDGRIKIVDFGLGKIPAALADADASTAGQQGLTQEHAVLGTAGYMSPEQVNGRTIDFRSDQFALCSMMYEMLTGRRAFKRNTPVLTMAAVSRYLARCAGSSTKLASLVTTSTSSAHDSCWLWICISRISTRRSSGRCWSAASKLARAALGSASFSSSSSASSA